MEKRTKRTAKNIKETAKIAGIFLEKILKKGNFGKGAVMVCLSGDLGAGKTALVKEIAKHLGIKRKIQSPTFVIVKKYALKNKNHKFLFHIDAYRLKNEKELSHLGWEEIISSKDHIVFLEWPENVRKIIPSHAKHIFISIKNEKGHRSFKLKQ
ncbi:MAG: Hydrolase, P-loop family [Parcubacteria group bacterium GW2011_GWF2_44_7]|nr:MAG: Hydrolase, P-loop family [Parcubacteria group bacterium GW2011_GWF2_44_7]